MGHVHVPPSRRRMLLNPYTKYQNARMDMPDYQVCAKMWMKKEKTSCINTGYEIIIENILHPGHRNTCFNYGYEIIMSDI
jgi:hypothetical protein